MIITSPLILATMLTAATEYPDTRGTGRSDLEAVSNATFPAEPTIDDTVDGQHNDDRLVGGTVTTLAAGATGTNTPSNLAQVTIDIAEGDRVKVGSFIQVHVTSLVSGAAVVSNENPDGHGYQFYPSRNFPAPRRA